MQGVAVANRTWVIDDGGPLANRLCLRSIPADWINIPNKMHPKNIDRPMIIAFFLRCICLEME
eukprot:scaffold164_cov266-Chaetoceros_neogracile.AAC.43